MDLFFQVEEIIQRFGAAFAVYQLHAYVQAVRHRVKAVALHLDEVLEHHNGLTSHEVTVDLHGGEG